MGMTRYPDLDKAKHALETIADKYKSHQTKDSSYCIGGNFYARQSGDIKVVINQHFPGDRYNSDDCFAVAIKIGNAINKEIIELIQKEAEEAIGEMPSYKYRHGGNYSLCGIIYPKRTYHNGGQTTFTF